jgi:hypothetical protein
MWRTAVRVVGIIVTFTAAALALLYSADYSLAPREPVRLAASLIALLALLALAAHLLLHPLLDAAGARPSFAAFIVRMFLCFLLTLPLAVLIFAVWLPFEL